MSHRHQFIFKGQCPALLVPSEGRVTSYGRGFEPDARHHRCLFRENHKDFHHAVVGDAEFEFTANGLVEHATLMRVDEGPWVVTA